MGAILPELRELNVGLVAIRNSIDASASASTLAMSMFVGMAEAESENTRLRVSRSGRALFDAGRWPGGNRPYGWRSQPIEDGLGYRLVQDAEEVARIREAVAWVLEGVSIRQVAHRWNEAG